MFPIILWTDKAKLNFLGGLNHVTSGVILTHHFIREHHTKQSNMVVWWSEAVLLLLAWTTWIKRFNQKILKENAWLSVYALKLKLTWIMKIHFHCTPSTLLFHYMLNCPIHETKQTLTSDMFQVEKPKAIKCGTFGATSLQQRHIATGDFDGNLNIWYCIHQLSVLCL